MSKSQYPEKGRIMYKMSSPSSSGTDHCTTKEKKAMISAVKVWVGETILEILNLGGD
jgi:hypothetical protein